MASNLSCSSPANFTASAYLANDSLASSEPSDRPTKSTPLAAFPKIVIARAFLLTASSILPKLITAWSNNAVTSLLARSLRDTPTLAKVSWASLLPCAASSIFAVKLDINLPAFSAEPPFWANPSDNAITVLMATSFAWATSAIWSPYCKALADIAVKATATPALAYLTLVTTSSNPRPIFFSPDSNSAESIPKITPNRATFCAIYFAFLLGFIIAKANKLLLTCSFFCSSVNGGYKYS